MAPADTSSLLCVSSMLRRDAWAFFLQDYPDRVFIDAILHIIDHGCDIGFLGDQNISQLCSNLSSMFLHPEAIVSDINLQLSHGRISGPFNMPPLPDFHSSPLGIATRKHSNKLHRIHHLSWPHGSSVNDGIPDSEASITYDMFQTAVSDIINFWHDLLMIKLDLEQAFCHIPVRPFDWPLLGFWLGAFFYEKFLTFGAQSAPYIFNLFAEALHWILQHHLPAFIRHYLDDFLQIFTPQTPLDIVYATLEWTHALADSLGLCFQDSKVEGPTTCLEFLGIELDSHAMEARLPSRKIEFLSSLLSQRKSKTHCTLLELQELTGYLQFCSQVIPYSCAFLCSFHLNI